MRGAWSPAHYSGDGTRDTGFVINADERFRPTGLGSTPARSRSDGEATDNGDGHQLTVE